MWYIHTMEYYSAEKKAKQCHIQNMDKSQKYYAELRKTDINEHMSYKSNYMKF